MKNFIFLLQRIAEADYDEIAAFGIVAANEQEAREIAHTCYSERHYDRKGRTWKLQTLSSCKRLGSAFGKQKKGIFITDFKAG